jgi:hypothetical protein
MDIHHFTFPKGTRGMRRFVLASEAEAEIAKLKAEIDELEFNNEFMSNIIGRKIPLPNNRQR